ncbi:MAG: hypothetical protein FD166_2561 [Bacteroidetes bacterium]|nr:MAG: hypothetical protein FD166_2561 [Bacteroidota bacterium]
MNHLSGIYTGAVALLIIVFLSASCTKEEPIDKDPGLKLEFSGDTVFFDTVFTSVGTATQIFKVFNPSKDRIIISSIELARGEASPFRFNIDGIASTRITDLEIAGNDSVFVFVKVTIDPGQANAPLVQNDSIVFITNNNRQDVKLLAWGQDAYFYRNGIIGSDYIFTADKPHVIYGFLAVDSLYTLTIEAGARVCLHAGAILLVYRDATLKVNGTAENPVIFEGDRLEDYFRDIPGQWGRIWLYAGSIDNEINYAIIRNGEVGIHADTTGNSLNPTLRISNSLIYNMSETGILGQGTRLKAANCVIGNCGSQSVTLSLGGDYDFRHCTIGNFWNRSYRKVPALLLNNYYYDTSNTVQVRDLTRAYFGNCVIYGEKDEEIALDQDAEGGIFNYRFDHCLLKTELNTSSELNYINCIKNEDPWFKDPYISSFQPDTLISAVVDKGSAQITSGAFINLNTDLDGNSRISDTAPDLGAYEFKEAVPARRRR